MTQLDAGALKPKREPCDLHDLVGGRPAPLRQAGWPSTRSSCRSANLPMLMLDDVLMEQVLANLLDNASKYTPAGSTIEVVAAQYKFSLLVSVRDEGPGIPEGDLQKVFDKFFRARAAGDRGRGGTGPGSGHLPRLRRSHGRTHLRPQPHDPRPIPGRRIRHRVLARSDRRTPPHGDRMNLDAGRILVVDDEPAIRPPATQHPGRAGLHHPGSRPAWRRRWEVLGREKSISSF